MRFPRLPVIGLALATLAYAWAAARFLRYGVSVFSLAPVFIGLGLALAATALALPRLKEGRLLMAGGFTLGGFTYLVVIVSTFLEDSPSLFTGVDALMTVAFLQSAWTALDWHPGAPAGSAAWGLRLNAAVAAIGAFGYVVLATFAGAGVVAFAFLIATTGFAIAARTIGDPLPATPTAPTGPSAL